METNTRGLAASFALSLALLAVPLVGCHDDSASGRMDRAGDRVDNAAGRTGDRIENAADRAGDNVKDATHNAAENVRDATR